MGSSEDASGGMDDYLGGREEQNESALRVSNDRLKQSEGHIMGTLSLKLSTKLFDLHDNTRASAEQTIAATIGQNLKIAFREDRLPFQITHYDISQFELKEGLKGRKLDSFVKKGADAELEFLKDENGQIVLHVPKTNRSKIYLTVTQCDRDDVTVTRKTSHLHRGKTITLYDTKGIKYLVAIELPGSAPEEKGPKENNYLWMLLK